MLIARIPLDGPQGSPGRRGLLAAAIPLEGLDDDFGAGGQWPGWVGGFEFLADACDSIDPMPIECVSDEKAENENVASVVYNPFLVFGFDKCSAMDRNRDRAGRARRNLEDTRSFQVEQEFFDGVASLQVSAGDDRNQFLTDGTATDLGAGSAFPAMRGLAALEVGLARCLKGRRGVIHATPDVVSLWDSGGGLRVEGGLVLTVMDTIVVAGAGYSGNDPDGAAPTAGSSWAYGTGLVYSKLSTVVDFADQEPESRYDRAVNTITWRIEQAVAVVTSPCCKVAAEIDLAAATGGGDGGDVDGGGP